MGMYMPESVRLRQQKHTHRCPPRRTAKRIKQVHEHGVKQGGASQRRRVRPLRVPLAHLAEGLQRLAVGGVNVRVAQHAGLHLDWLRCRFLLFAVKQRLN
jgi:hypothetical protein